MRWAFKKTDLEIQSASGLLRVAIKPHLNLLLVVAEAVALGVIIYLFRIGWFNSHQGQGGYWFLLAAAAAASLWFQVSGAEEIEFDAQRQVLTIRRSALRWPRTSEYPLELVRALQTHYDHDHTEPDGLRCQVGNMTIRFAKGLNAEQADKVLAELQSAFPDSSHRMLSEKEPFGDHFTTLKLN